MLYQAGACFVVGELGGAVGRMRGRSTEGARLEGGLEAGRRARQSRWNVGRCSQWESAGSGRWREYTGAKRQLRRRLSFGHRGVRTTFFSALRTQFPVTET